MEDVMNSPSAFPAHRLQAQWPILAILASAAMLASAHAFQHLGGFAPCPLCLRQREVYWAAIAIAGFGLIATRLWPALFVPRATAALLAVAFLGGAGVAFFQAGSEYGFWPSNCGVTQMGPISVEEMQAALDAPPTPVVRCDQAAWSLFGVSMAGYNGLISLVLAGVSLALAFVPGQRPEASE
jgi:disulfide bond formation protein DsbB